MSDGMQSRQRLRSALRQQELATAKHRAWKWTCGIAVVWSIGLLSLWAVTIRWSVASIGVRDLGATPMAVCLGLFVLTVATAFGAAEAFVSRSEAHSALTQANWEYEDAVLEDGGML